MFSIFRLDRLTTLICLSLLSLTACRFGNQVQTVPNPVAVKYLQTTPQTLSFCAIPAPNSPQVCKPASLAKIPPSVSLVMTQPLALIIDQDQKAATLVGLTSDQVSLPTDYHADNTLDFVGQTPEEVLWEDSACTTNLWVQERDGKITPLSSDEPTTAPPPATSKLSATSLPLSGHLEMSIDVVRNISGDCAASLQAMHDCYLDYNQCGGATASDNLQRLALVQSYFEDAIEAGVLAPSDIPTVSQISYSVSYL